MSSSDAVVAQSAFNTLRLGSSVQIIVGRLLRFWNSKNIKKQGEIMGITLLLLDEKNSVIHGFIPTGRAPYYLEIESADFSNVCSALGSPLTKSIYFIDGVVRVFFGSDFVTVTV
ncbi:hypothetical protein F2Q69_00029238 [Brassica cretica]|uniref:Scaffold protein Nfu/NifU N-terminal domain-containing protein n=1 Tax=Brassica cretica TaxID=69181 RepID=A0A8S9RYR8_BRACR|nr:hypothetical protein F2Q69_00029238 [Brassica cretica]